MLNNEYPPLGGGTGTVNRAILEGFLAYPAIKIDLITGCTDKKKKITHLSDNVRIIYLPLQNKNIHHASNFELIKYAFHAFFLAFKMQRKEKYDFSFAWSTVPAGFVSFLLLYIFKLPYLVRVGGPDIPGFEERYKSIYKIISPIIRIIWRKSKLIVAKCNLEKEMIISINPKLKIEIIHNGVNIHEFKPIDKALKQNLTSVCPARLIKRKGQDLLIKALAELKLKGITLLLNLVGDGDEKDNYQRLAKELNVLQQIDFKGYIPRKLMKKEYHEADLFVLPSYNEGMSNSLLEAMACGLPVIVTDVGGTTELVTQGKNGFVFPVGDKSKLVSILETIAVSPAILHEMGIKSREYAETLDWKKIVEAYFLLFNAFNNKFKKK